MKVLISADMEGTCGVVDWVQVTPPWDAPASAAPSEYETARRQMTAEVAAAVRGALAGGASGVTVNEAHDGMKNLIGALLPREARLITGHHKPLSMMQGIDEPGMAAAIFTGYHGKATTPQSVLAHSFTGFVQDIRFDGLSTGEYGVNAAIAGHFDVPVVMVTGGDICIAQVKAFCGDAVVGVEVKKELGTKAASHLHPELAVELIESGAREALQLAREIPPWKLRPGARVELDLAHQEQADLAALALGVERTGNLTVAFDADDALHMMHMLRSMFNAIMTKFAV
ncbi:MAG: peptide ABC transporter [Chloroflexi bacterium]|nr:MAG: peptide ABC transporter [Chloroflexota bacterium]